MHIKLLNIEAFGGCNFSCQMCPQSKEMGGRERDFLKTLPYDIFEKVVLDAMQYGLEAVSLHGSGEPTSHRKLVEMVAFLKKHKLHASFFTNGLRLDGDLFERLVVAGIDLVTVSIVGADRETYKKWMNKDAFDHVIANLHECKDVMERYPDGGKFHTRHLITSSDKNPDGTPLSKAEWDDVVRREVDLYQSNISNPLDCFAEIWMMHNWSGDFESTYDRLSHATSKKLRSCGRPFAETLEVRAGGLNGHYAAVVPCPFVLGKDSQAVLGHLDTQTIAEVMSDQPLIQLRRAHLEERFEEIPYCKGCDMLVDDQEVLAWSNITGRYVGQSKTSTVDYPKAPLKFETCT
jgi:organic radical activating enzyme